MKETIIIALMTLNIADLSSTEKSNIQINEKELTTSIYKSNHTKYSLCMIYPEKCKKD